MPRKEKLAKLFFKELEARRCHLVPFLTIVCDVIREFVPKIAAYRRITYDLGYKQDSDTVLVFNDHSEFVLPVWDNTFQELLHGKEWQK